jgi:hypothetical protein
LVNIDIEILIENWVQRIRVSAEWAPHFSSTAHSEAPFPPYPPLNSISNPTSGGISQRELIFTREPRRSK